MGERALRIAVFSDSALPILNGVSVSIDVLNHELRRRGHSVHLFAVNVPGAQDTDPNTHRFWGLETPISRGYPVAIPPFYRMLRTFRKQEFDIIHTHTPFFLGMVGLRWAESHDLPIVSTYHTLYDRYAHYFPVLPRRYIRFKVAKHTNFYYNHVQHVFTPSEVSAKWLRRHSVDTPITVVPTAGTAVRTMNRAEVRFALGIPPEAKILLYVGRLAREKNLETLLDAAKLMFSADPSLWLWFVGDGPFREECVDMVRARSMGNRVKFVGFVPRAEVDRYYAAADLFLFASITETQGLVVQEAMSYGLPAVVVAGGGASAAVIDGETGFVTKNEPDVLAHQGLAILQDSALYDRLSRAATVTGRGYTVESMTDRVTDVYRHVLSGASCNASVRSLSS